VLKEHNYSQAKMDTKNRKIVEMKFMANVAECMQKHMKAPN
jgi:hypothetical protein